jgi:hypothetical protein
MFDYDKAQEITEGVYNAYRQLREIEQAAITAEKYFLPVTQPFRLDNNFNTKTPIGTLHDYGLISDFYKVFWIRIPKCANSYLDSNLRGIMRDINFKKDFEKFAQESEYRGCVILRDPIERWISAANTMYDTLLHVHGYSELDQSCYDFLITKSLLSHSFFNFLIENLITDYHGMLQSYYLYPCNLKNIDFFYLHNNTGNHLNSYFKSYQIYNTITNDKYNYTNKKSFFYKFIVQFLTDHQNKKYLDKIKEIVQPDYDLINCIHFYNRH